MHKIPKKRERKCEDKKDFVAGLKYEFTENKQTKHQLILPMKNLHN